MQRLFLASVMKLGHAFLYKLVNREGAGVVGWIPPSITDDWVPPVFFSCGPYEIPHPDKVIPLK